LATISLCMIVKNEEEHIGRCLDSVADIVDEIIIVDTGSTDQTKSIIRQYVNNVFDFEWIDDFAAARNYSFSLASMDYILWLDADDVLEEQDRHKLISLKNILDPSVDSVNMAYHLAFDDFGNVTSSVRRNRLVKRSNYFKWNGMVHEYLQVSGKIIESDITVTHRSIHHDSDRNLRIYEKLLAQGIPFTPRDLYYYANELKDHRIFDRAIHYYEKFLATEQGWIEDILSTCGKLADCYHELGDHEQEIESTLRAFLYSSPRAEHCCRMGYYFIQNNEYVSAVYWYKTAIQVSMSDTSWGFTNHSCSTWLPHLQLCVCYDRLGEYELAYKHTDKVILSNKEYLESVIANNK
jgi:glycosyltransferase involved in cell wall biosynthesis